MLLLDDLHWADTATLLLLKYVARYPRTGSLMIVGSYRETDIAARHPLAAVLADLARDQLGERLALGRLDAAAVSELVSWYTGNRAPADVHRMIFEETDGLPFFVVEFSRHLSESAPAQRTVPEGVRDLICSRLSHLGPETTRALETASVVGQAFAFELLERLCDVSQDDLVDALDRAVRAQLVQEPAAGNGRYGFAHALIRDVLYGTLTATRRTLLHRRVAAAIEEAGAVDGEDAFAELAHHLGLAGSAEDLDRAIHYAVLAGDRALALLAYEQAAAHYRRAVETLDRRGAPGCEAQRCELTIAQGEAERMAGDPAHRSTLLRAAALALQMGDATRLARAALANNRGFNSSSQGVDRDRVSALESALATLGDADSATRAGLLAQLSLELIGHRDWRRRAQLAGDALAMARRVGDPRTLARVLTQVCVALVKPGTTAVRTALLREAWQLANRTGDRLLAAQAANFAINAALETGDVAHAREQLERLEALAAQLGQPMIEWYVAVAHAKLRMLTGSPKDAEPLAVAAYELGRRAGQPDAFVFLLAHLYIARLLRGTLGEGEPNLAELFAVPGSSPPVGPEFEPSRSIPLMVGAAASAINCEIGRLEEGRAHFDLLMSQLDDLPHDYSTLAILASASIACGHLRDGDRARELHDALVPFAGQFVGTGATGPQWLGAVDHHLGVLCAVIGRDGAADEHFSAAQDAYLDMGSPAWLMRCRMDWAAVLVERADGDDAARAHGLIAEAVQTARELGLPAWGGGRQRSGSARPLADASADAPASPRAVEFEQHCEGGLALADSGSQIGVARRSRACCHCRGVEGATSRAQELAAPHSPRRLGDRRGVRARRRRTGRTDDPRLRSRPHARRGMGRDRRLVALRSCDQAVLARQVRRWRPARCGRRRATAARAVRRRPRDEPRRRDVRRVHPRGRRHLPPERRDRYREEARAAQHVDARRARPDDPAWRDRLRPPHHARRRAADRQHDARLDGLAAAHPDDGHPRCRARHASHRLPARGAGELRRRARVRAQPPHRRRPHGRPGRVRRRERRRPHAPDVRRQPRGLLVGAHEPGLGDRQPLHPLHAARLHVRVRAGIAVFQLDRMGRRGIGRRHRQHVRHRLRRRPARVRDPVDPPIRDECPVQITGRLRFNLRP